MIEVQYMTKSGFVCQGVYSPRTYWQLWLLNPSC